MATFWSGSVALTAGQVAMTECTALRLSGDSCSLQLQVNDPAFQITSTFAPAGVESTSADTPFISSIEVIDTSPTPGGMMRVKFIAGHDCVATVEWHIATGDAALEQPSVTAE